MSESVIAELILTLLAIFVLCVALLDLITRHMGLPTHIHVAEHGDDEFGDGSRGSPFKTLDAALRKSQRLRCEGKISRFNPCQIHVAEGCPDRSVVFCVPYVSVVGEEQANG